MSGLGACGADDLDLLFAGLVSSQTAIIYITAIDTIIAY